MKTFTRIPVAKNFFLDEFLPPVLYDQHKNDLAKSILDHRVFTVVQFLRDKYGKPIYLNNWYQLVTQIMKKEGLTEWPELIHVEAFCKKYGHVRDFFDERCVRDPQTSTGAPKSRHKFERTKSGILIARKTDAFDLDYSGMTGAEGHEWQKQYHSELYAMGVRRMEDPSITPGWNHQDMKEHGMGKGIQVFNLVEQTDFIRIP